MRRGQGYLYIHEVVVVLVAYHAARTSGSGGLKLTVQLRDIIIANR
jgi:hypothetical protein